MLNILKRLNLNKLFLVLLSGVLLYLLTNTSAYCLTYNISSDENFIGEYQKIKAEHNDTLTGIAERYDIGVYDMVAANSHLSNKALKAGTIVVIPSSFALPSGAREGIVINLASMRIFHFYPDSNKVSTYPVGIGRQGWGTPLGKTRIVSKQEHPAWHPPESIRREVARNGEILPLVVPAGPHNPLGQYAMHLGFNGILMHGTNNPSSVGLRSSHGCMRMYADDIEELFSTTNIGTLVRVIFEPSYHRE